MAINNDTIGIVLFVLAIFAAILNVLSIVYKLCKDFTTPKLWKYSLLYQDTAYCCLSLGLLVFFIYSFGADTSVCDAAGFFLLFGIVQCLLSYITTGIILLSIQNPGKSSSISNFHRNIFIVIVTPEIIIGCLLSSLPYISDRLFNTDLPFDIACFPIRDHGQQGAAYGTLLVAICWIVVIAIAVCDVIIALKLWKFNNRIHSAQNNVWQAQLIVQGKILVIVLLIEHVVCIVVILTTTLSIYVNVDIFSNNKTWIVMTSLAVSVIVHGVVSNICNVMWTSCCCRDNSAVKEPHRKLKKLELLNIETTGKLRMKATWTIGKHATKRGLMKVYGTNHLKTWAQEIVMLGMLRRIQHPSLIQCLWTNSSNPYYETMTLISGEIITSDSRIICLELTNGGTLHDFLQKAELPLPEQCQRMIVHDVAEGLFYLHHENILHNNLSTSCVYLKGSLQSMVLRAAVGDFEEALIYGTLQQSVDNSVKDKRHFFLPDIRSFALVALQVVSRMSEKKFQNRYVHYNAEHVPLKLNLTSVISDEEDEFQAQYSYEAEDTHRMFRAIHDDDNFSSDESEENFQIGKKESGSLANLTSPRRAMSPLYTGRDVSTPDTIIDSGDSDNDTCNADVSENPTTQTNIPRSKNNITELADANERLNKSHEKSIVSSKKLSTRAKSKSVDSLGNDSANLFRQFDSGRCVSPDPMKDETLQKLRKETKSSAMINKKERKFSFSRKKSEEEFFQNGKMEAFVKSDARQNEKRKDGKWLNKPGSILKSITSNDTTVSVFKAKPTDEESHLDAIEEEDISPGQSSFPRQVKVKEAKINKPEVWDIIDEQYYTQVNKKALNKLKKTVSGESRSSLWSFISTPEDLDEDDMDDILECLPGMTDPFEYRKPEITVSDIMAERDYAKKKDSSKKKFNFTQMSKSKFELIDYYEMLKAKQITINDIPEDKREMLLNVVELKLEEKRKRDHTVNTVIRSDEMYDNNMSPVSTCNNSNSGKVKMVSFRKTQSPSSPLRHPFPAENDPRLDRARSAPLKRSRTPVIKPPTEKTPELNPAFHDSKAVTYAKRNRARAALKRAIHNKGKQSLPRHALERGQQDLAVKYATVRKVAYGSNEAQNKAEAGELITVPVPTSESFSIMNQKMQKNHVKRFSSFSSNESASTLSSSERQRTADTSLTSGELSSLSSQAESEHYETDYHMTSVENEIKLHSEGRKTIQTPSSRVDSGFDSSSISSEMSDAFTNRKLHLNTQFQIASNKGVVDSWARNYKMVDSSLDLTPNSVANKCLPPVGSLSEQTSTGENKNVNDNKLIVNTDRECVKSDISRGKGNNVRNRKRAIPRRQNESHTLNITPYTTVSSRPDPPHSRSMSPPSRIMSPVGRPMSPSRSLSPTSSRQSLSNGYENATNITQTARPMSPDVRPKSPISRPMSPLNRPMSPNVQPTNNYAVKSNSTSSISRALSPTAGLPKTINSKPFSPGRKLSRPVSPKEKSTVPDTSKEGLNTNDVSDSVSLAESSTSKASKRYRELVKKGVPLRTSVIDASPTRLEGHLNELDTRPATAESMFEEPPDDQELFENLEANGFFANRARSRSPSPNKFCSSGQSKRSANNKPNGKHAGTRRKKKRPIPLEEIVRESPDSRKGKPHRSASKNHLAVTDEAILNQPTSEDSETCSIKTNKSSTSSPSGSKPKMMIDAELVIDRIFSQNQHENNELDVEVEAALGLDKDPFKAVKEMYLENGPCETPNLNEIPLLNGVTQKHVHECIEMVSGLHVLSLRDLLPASQTSFQVLRNKLQQVGQLGTVGNQLLDVIHKCWLQDMPPSSGDLVEQLTDPVTETEL
ncbi:uncharacterized protein LOC123536166 isoform X2 [Mercenaria mercenaria]|uniref:uncharacterized protein LOC123536166 isoform X2 n=1 Tax=Mercenaria mercenaria TaxID=6596 RepID=UPI00234E5C56|nr:uncharacterized protein LOC123536166 isoform X2 [Mercenaria mercenaria]